MRRTQADAAEMSADRNDRVSSTTPSTSARYTATDEAKTIFRFPARRTASSVLTVPITFTSAPTAGSRANGSVR